MGRLPLLFFFCVFCVFLKLDFIVVFRLAVVVLMVAIIDVVFIVIVGILMLLVGVRGTPVTADSSSLCGSLLWPP